MSGVYSPLNDREITGLFPLYSVVGELDATQNTQVGPIITPQTDVNTFLGDGAPFGVKPGSTLVALMIALVIVAGAAVLLKTKSISF